MIDEMEYRICETQAELYEYAANNGYVFPHFSDVYLTSSFCERAMDTIYSRFQLQYPEELMDFLGVENTFIKGDSDIDGEVAYWIGFTYRQMYFELKRASKELVKLFPFDMLKHMYVGLHTQDPEYVSEVLKENLKKRL